MKRRESLKFIAAGAFATGSVLAGCKESVKKPEIIPPANDKEQEPGMYKEEAAYEKAIEKQDNFFNTHEMASITMLCDMIIPRDEISGNASDAKVPDFIEFMVKDVPQYQTPVRGGLKWLDMQCFKNFNKPFKDCGEEQRIKIIDSIAYPEKAKKDKSLAQGVAFFSLMRNLTASGFYTSEIGINDIGYQGNKPHQWNGVPGDVLKQYGLAYTDRELNETVKFDA